MSQLILEIPSGSQPLYLRIGSAVVTAIHQERLLPGEKLPSARNLATQLNISRHTIMAAFAELVAEGWLETKPRSGYCVVNTLPIIEPLTVSPQSDQPTTPAQSHLARYQFVRQGPQRSQRIAAEYQFNFTGGQPDINLFPFEEFRSFINDSLKRLPKSQLSYGNNKGHLPFIEQVRHYLAQTRCIKNKSIVVTHGSQEALFISAQLLIKPGDQIAVESLGYPPAWSAFKAAGGELIGIKQDQQGLDINDLEKKLQRHNIRFLYITPLHQYPTTVTLSALRRSQLYRLARQHNVIIIEDDYDHEFHYRCQPLAPLAANDPDNRVIYLSSFSKILFPSIRLGVMAVAEELAEQIACYRQIIDHKNDVIMQHAISLWMKDGGFERHMRRLTRTYHKRRDHMVSELNALKRHYHLEFKIPDGGMAIWLNTYSDTRELINKAQRHDIYLQTEKYFQLCSSQKHSHIRLGFSGMEPTKQSQALKYLFPSS